MKRASRVERGAFRRLLSAIRYTLSAIRLPWGFRVALAVLVLVVLSLYIGLTSGAFTGFPKGDDSFGHLALGQIIKENFPYVFWNPYWDGGTVLFPRNYPPLFHFGVGLLAKAFSLEVTEVTQFLLALSIILTAIFIFLTLWILTRKSLVGLFSSLFFLASSTVWYSVVSGLYPQVLAMMTISLVVFSLVWYLYWSKWSNWSYWLVVFSFVLAYLTHFLAVFLTSFSLIVFLLFRKGSQEEKIKQALKIFLPVWGLTAFYYLPVLLARPLGLLGEFGGGKYEPWEFLSLFKQGYPGLPFMSLPLGLFVLILIFLLKYKIIGKKRQIFKIFLGFGILAFFCLFFSIYPGQFLLPLVFYLSLFLGLGIYFLGELKIITRNLFLLLLIGLVAMALIQTPHLKKIAIDQSRVYPKKVLGGYWEPGIIHPEFQHWFEKEVFMTVDNPQETKFLLDWYGIKNFKAGKFPGIRQKFLKDQENFALVAGDEFEYKKAKPVIIATKAPVVLIKKDKEYFDFVVSLAKKGIDSQQLIPIKSQTAKPEDFSEGELGELDFSQQFPKFVNSQRREIELKEYYPGVLLKESYFGNWRAYLERSASSVERQRLPIYFAGPGMMYVSLPKDYSLPAKVVFEYQPGWAEKLGLVISIGSLLGLVLKRRALSGERLGD